MGIICWFQKSNTGDLQLRSWKSRAQQDYRVAREKTLFEKTKFMIEKNDT